MSTPEATAETEDSLAEFEDALAAAKSAAADTVKHEAEWSRSKAIKKGSALATYVDDAMTHYLAGRVTQTAKDADQLERQLSRMKIAAEQRALKAQIAANEARLKALTS